MKIYTCPMHPEIKQNEPGNCPKCGGMKLVISDSLKNKVVSQNDENRSVDISKWKGYVPLAIIIGLISITTIVLSFRDSQLVISQSQQPCLTL
jgi:uncharacterized membrane protein YvbJ